MKKEEYEKLVKSCNKLINKYIFLGKKFIGSSCFQYGKFTSYMSGELDAHFISDFQYFVFTKGIKTLLSIRTLLKQEHCEDVLILLRSTFEGYMSSRFIDEEFEPKLLNDFIVTPRLLSHRKAIYQDNKVIDRYSKEIIDFYQRNPSEMKLGKDKNYFYSLYDYLCDYAHCNFSILNCYIDNHEQYTIEKATNSLLVRVLVVFIYTKLFENIVTVEGEEFYDKQTEENCYELVKNSTTFLYDILDYFSKYSSADVNPELNSHMKKMFKEMRKSLKEEIGSVSKAFLLQQK